MNKKGFTLMEVLIVIVILTAVSVSSIIVFDKIDDDTVNKNKESTYKAIQRAAITYLDMVNGGLEELSDKKEVYINLYTLIDNNYVSSKTMDPLTGEAFPSSYVIKVFIARDEFDNNYLNSCILDKKITTNTQCIANRDGVFSRDCCAACPSDEEPGNDGTVTCN